MCILLYKIYRMAGCVLKSLILMKIYKKVVKKLLILLFLFFAISCSSFSIELTGGVTYTVNSARDYLFQNIPKPNISSNYIFARTSNVEKVIYSYDTDNRVIGITVLYKDDFTQAYIYDENKKLIYVDKYDKNVNLYPHRGYRYNMQSKLILTSLSVSKNEHFRFDSQGNLIAHSINNIIYDENGNVIGSSK